MQLPPTWRVARLEELQSSEPRAITDGPFGSNLASAHYTEQGPRVVRLQNIGDGHFVDAKAHISESHFRSLRQHEVQSGDLLVASLGEVLPRACLAPEWLGPAIVKADCIRIRLADTVDRRWVLYALRRPSVRRWADEHRHGVGRPRLGLKVIRDLPIPLPGLLEQRRIVEILEDHFSRLDAADESLAMNLIRTKTLRASLMNSALKGLEGRRTTLGEVAVLRNGIFVSRAKDVPIGVPILRIGAVRPLNLDLTNIRYSERPESELAAEGSLLTPGDLVFMRYNGNLNFVGACAVVPPKTGPLTYPDKLIRAKVCVRDVIPEYLAIACSVGSGRAQIRSFVKTTSGQAGISGRDLRSVGLTIPSMAMQEQILRRMNEKVDAVDRLARSIEAAQRRSAFIRTGLLSAAFSGRLTGRLSDMDRVEEMAGV